MQAPRSRVVETTYPAPDVDRLGDRRNLALVKGRTRTLRNARKSLLSVTEVTRGWRGGHQGGGGGRASTGTRHCKPRSFRSCHPSPSGRVAARPATTDRLLVAAVLATRPPSPAKHCARSPTSPDVCPTRSRPSNAPMTAGGAGAGPAG